MVHHLYSPISRRLVMWGTGLSANARGHFGRMGVPGYATRRAGRLWLRCDRWRFVFASSHAGTPVQRVRSPQKVQGAASARFCQQRLRRLRHLRQQVAFLFIEGLRLVPNAGSVCICKNRTEPAPRDEGPGRYENTPAIRGVEFEWRICPRLRRCTCKVQRRSDFCPGWAGHCWV